MNKYISILVSVLFLMFPSISLGQEDTTGIAVEAQTEEVAIGEIEIEIDIEEVLPEDVAQVADTNSQDSTSPQVTEEVQKIDNGGVVLEDTFDPHDTNVVGGPASSTPINLPENPSPILSVEIIPVEIEPEITPIENTVTITEVMPELPGEVVKAIEAPTILTAEPDPEFTFKVANNSIPTNTKPEWQKTDKEKKAKTVGRQITATPNLLADNNEGRLDISGNCVDPYFVILIYTKPEEYDKNPGSYIFNKAFDCVNGKYFYELSQLPETLDDGTHYLLVAGQGNVGSWKPITALIPITIQNEHDE